MTKSSSEAGRVELAACPWCRCAMIHEIEGDPEDGYSIVISGAHEKGCPLTESDETGAVNGLSFIFSTDAEAQGFIDAWNRRPVAPLPAAGFDFEAHLARQAAWSEKTFGPGPRAKGVVDHIRRELLEIEADPGDLKEWIDVVILALDGAWRSGASPLEIISGIVAKQTKNEGRNWPDWRTADPDKAIEHVRKSPSEGDQYIGMTLGELERAHPAALAPTTTEKGET